MATVYFWPFAGFQQFARIIIFIICASDDNVFYEDPRMVCGMEEL